MVEVPQSIVFSDPLNRRDVVVGLRTYLGGNPIAVRSLRQQELVNRLDVQAGGAPRPITRVPLGVIAAAEALRGSIGQETIVVTRDAAKPAIAGLTIMAFGPCAFRNNAYTGLPIESMQGDGYIQRLMGVASQLRALIPPTT